LVEGKKPSKREKNCKDLRVYVKKKIYRDFGGQNFPLGKIKA
jgi:hypothetical protein